MWSSLKAKKEKVTIFPHEKEQPTHHEPQTQQKVVTLLVYTGTNKRETSYCGVQYVEDCIYLNL